MDRLRRRVPAPRHLRPESIAEVLPQLRRARRQTPRNAREALVFPAQDSAHVVRRPACAVFGIRARGGRLRFVGLRLPRVRGAGGAVGQCGPLRPRPRLGPRKEMHRALQRPRLHGRADDVAVPALRSARPGSGSSRRTGPRRPPGAPRAPRRAQSGNGPRRPLQHYDGGPAPPRQHRSPSRRKHRNLGQGPQGKEAACCRVRGRRRRERGIRRRRRRRRHRRRRHGRRRRRRRLGPRQLRLARIGPRAGSRPLWLPAVSPKIIAEKRTAESTSATVRFF
mmetsp:Transcript_24078/g.82320  ORF Transcript_24078/g.82320 Transcript_24078/m.82320 type:complete len:280 (+) Transcript_24078:699-1538(+)